MNAPLTDVELKLLASPPNCNPQTKRNLKLAVAAFIEKYTLESLSDPAFMQEHPDETAPVLDALRALIEEQKERFSAVWKYLSKDKPIVFDTSFSSEERDRIRQVSDDYVALAARDVIDDLRAQLKTRWEFSSNTLTFTEFPTWTKDPEIAFIHLLIMYNDWGNLAAKLDDDLQYIEETLERKVEQALDFLTPAAARPLSDEEKSMLGGFMDNQPLWPQSTYFLIQKEIPMNSDGEKCAGFFLKFLEFQKERYPNILEAIEEGTFPARPPLPMSKDASLTSQMVFDAIDLTGIELHGKWYFNKSQNRLVASMPMPSQLPEAPALRLLATVFNERKKGALFHFNEDLKHMRSIEAEFERNINLKANSAMPRDWLPAGTAFLTAARNGTFQTLPEVRELLESVKQRNDDKVPINEVMYAMYRLQERFHGLSLCLFKFNPDEAEKNGAAISADALAAYLGDEERARRIAENWRVDANGNVFCQPLLDIARESDAPFMRLLSRLSEEEITRLNGEATALLAVPRKRIRDVPEDGPTLQG